VNAGSIPGTWTLTATVVGVPGQPSASWTLVVQPSTDNRLEPVAGNPTEVQVGQTVSGFAVGAVDAGPNGGDPSRAWR
jgi:hypothetical protein